MHWIALQPDASHGAGVGQEDLDTIADPLAALAWQALEFTPKVARVELSGQKASGGPHEMPLERINEALVMEISASERLFGGAKPLLRLIYQKNKPLGHMKYARAATSLVALAKLQMRGVVPCAADAALANLPLWTLATAHPHLTTLARIGCTTWGDLRALPRGGVARRFGAQLLDALDRAYGQVPEVYPWLTLPAVFEARIELHAQVETAPALMFGAQRLLKQLQLWLQLRNEGATALEFGWTMDERRNTARQGALTLRTAQATQDIAHLQRLLGENLARLTLPAPALYVSLRTLHTEPLATRSAPLLLEEAQKGDSLHEMVERVRARLGQDSVVQLQTRADYRPEIMQKWIFNENLNKFKSYLLQKNIAINRLNSRPNANLNSYKNSENKYIQNPLASSSATPQVKPKAASCASLPPDALAPTWLLSTPLPLAVQQGVPQYQGPLTLVAGPQRLEAAWWEGPHHMALRDYFIAQSEQAGLLWVFRERLGARSQEHSQGSSKASSQAGTDAKPGWGADSGAWYLQGRFD